MEHSRQWAVRADLERRLYDNNCFITLTYDDKYLPENKNLDYEAPVLFMKRLREKFPDSTIRSFGCAEYGCMNPEKCKTPGCKHTARPHYHLCLFNFDFSDKKFYKSTMEYGNHGSNNLYISDTLEEIWGKGFCTIGDLTFESAAYVARYVTKKITGDRAKTHYEKLDEATGEIHTLLPERAICLSRRPGIGRPWYERHGKFVLDHDYVLVRGRRMRPPKYFDRLSEQTAPERFKETKRLRAMAAKDGAAQLENEDLENIRSWLKTGGDYTALPTARLYVMEKVEELKFELLQRNLENG